MKKAMTMALSLLLLAIALVVFAGGFEIGVIGNVVSWIALFASALFIIERISGTLNTIDADEEPEEYELIFRVQ